MDFRIGHGYDVHRLAKGRELILGGVKIEHSVGLMGHSDADVLAHVVIDALLGAMAAGDIGGLFPDSDEKYKGADSLKLLGVAIELMDTKGWKILNIDSTIVAQAPKLAGNIYSMRENLARVCRCDIDSVSVKATTEEGLGFTGGGEGIAAHCVLMLATK